MIFDGLPVATLIHAGEGRARLRVVSRREDAAYFASVAAGLSAIRGVKNVLVTPLTGSVLVFHDVPLSRIGEEAQKKRLFSLVMGTTPNDSPRVSTLHISPRMGAAACLGMVALWQVYKEKFFPSALSVVIYAVSLAGLLPANETSATGE